MRFDTADELFAESGLRWMQSLDDATLADLAAVFEASPGYFPTTLLSLRQQELERRGLSATSRARLSVAVGSSLPVCHPADYEWRFCDQTADQLLELATASAPPRAVIAHLGTPTTFIRGIRQYREWDHVLLERSEALIRSIAGQNCGGHRIVPIDLQSERPPPLGAIAAIVDPPWYPRDTLGFLAATSSACLPSASILVCQPTIATRPGVRQERDAMAAAFPRLGLGHVETWPAALRYVTPHFESMSLRIAMGSTQVPSDWRKGDLLLLRKVGESVGDDPMPGSDDAWLEVQFGPVRIKLREAGETDLASLVPDDVLDTVSRRDPVRARIGMWTSGNRVYGLARPKLIGRFIVLCHNDLMHERFSSARSVELAAKLRYTGDDREKAVQYSCERTAGAPVDEGNGIVNHAAIMGELTRAVSCYADWAPFAPLILEPVHSNGVHIAVMVEPFLSYILDGSKTIESRFSKHLIDPYQRIAIGDLVFLKSGPIVAAFEASSVECVDLDDAQRRRLRESYSGPLRADEEFWAQRADRNYATLIGIRNVRRLTPLPVPKHDRRGWMVLRSPANAPSGQLPLM